MKKPFTICYRAKTFWVGVIWLTDKSLTVRYSDYIGDPKDFKIRKGKK